MMGVPAQVFQTGFQYATDNKSFFIIFLLIIITHPYLFCMFDFKIPAKNAEMQKKQGCILNYTKYPSKAWIVVAYPIFTIIIIKYFITAYRQREINSVFDFIKNEFDENTKRLAISIYILQSIIYLAVTIYAPALALRFVIKGA